MAEESIRAAAAADAGAIAALHEQAFGGGVEAAIVVRLPAALADAAGVVSHAPAFELASV